MFPSEAIWALGLMGAYGAHDSASVRAYKSRKARRLGVEDAHDVARRPLQGFSSVLAAGGVPVETTTAWIEAIAAEAVRCARGRDGVPRKSKAFDDPIDSGLAFLTAVACAVGQFHEWGDGTDGTIVGPGRLHPP